MCKAKKTFIKYLRLVLEIYTNVTVSFFLFFKGAHYQVPFWIQKRKSRKDGAGLSVVVVCSL